jgi:hypothetical protein
MLIFIYAKHVFFKNKEKVDALLITLFCYIVVACNKIQLGQPLLSYIDPNSSYSHFIFF